MLTIGKIGPWLLYCTGRKGCAAVAVLQTYACSGGRPRRLGANEFQEIRHKARSDFGDALLPTSRPATTNFIQQLTSPWVGQHACASAPLPYLFPAPLIFSQAVSVNLLRGWHLS